jgi:hypothetical protein
MKPTPAQPNSNSLKVKTSLKAGLAGANHNETLMRGLRVRTGIKGGALTNNHNETLAVCANR